MIEFSDTQISKRVITEFFILTKGKASLLLQMLRFLALSANCILINPLACVPIEREPKLMQFGLCGDLPNKVCSF